MSRWPNMLKRLAFITQTFGHLASKFSEVPNRILFQLPFKLGRLPDASRIFSLFKNLSILSWLGHLSIGGVLFCFVQGLLEVLSATSL